MKAISAPIMTRMAEVVESFELLLAPVLESGTGAAVVAGTGGGVDSKNGPAYWGTIIACTVGKDPALNARKAVVNC